MNRNNFLSLYLLASVFLFSACSTTEIKTSDDEATIPVASKESDVTDPNKSTSSNAKKWANRQSTVYFYRPDRTVFGWTWKDITIMEIHALGIITDPDEKTQVSHIGNLKNNSYIKKQFKSGTHRFTANWELEPYEFTLKPNQTMCIKAEIGFVNALRHRATLKIIDKDLCDTDIVNAKEVSN